MTCWGQWMLRLRHAVLLMSFRGWNTDWGITWGMRCSGMFIHVKTSSTEEGMMAFIRAPLCGLRRVPVHTRELELIAAARVNACVGFIQHVSEPSSGSPKRLYSDLSCHIKDSQNTIYYLIILKKKLKQYCVCLVHMRNRKTLCTVTPLIYIYKYKVAFK